MTLRHKGRELALQLLYQWELRGIAPEQVEEAFWPGAKAAAQTREFAHTLFTGAVASSQQIDALIETHATNWRLDRMSAIDRNILRLATFELRFATAPSNVVLDEAVELAKTFSDETSPAFVNGILDAIEKAGKQKEASDEEKSEEEKSETPDSKSETRKVRKKAKTKSVDHKEKSPS
jgi:transcription antitermination protein NusB